MIKKIINSFIPYLFLLLGIFILVIYLDAYAKKVSDAPEVITIEKVTDINTEDIIQFEADDKNTNANESMLQNDTAFQKAVELYREKEYNEAGVLFEQLELIHKNPVIYQYLGLTALKQLRYTDAKDYFSTVIRLDSSYAAAYINLAVTSSKLRQHSNAETYYQQAIRLQPANDKSYYNLGLLYSKMEAWQKAISAFEKSIELSSGDDKAKGFCYRGIAQLSLRDTAAARESFRNSIEYRPQYQLPRIHLALTTPDIQTREDELLKVYRLNTNSYYANFYLGKLYADQNLFSKAEHHLRKALEINPADEEVMEALSAFLLDQQRFTEAELIIRGFSIHDTLPQTYFQQARMASKQDLNEDAAALYQLAIEKSGFDYPEAALNLALLYKEQNQPEKAIETYREATRMKPDYAIAYYNMALLHGDLGNIEEQIQNYKLAIKHDPYHSKSWYNLAQIYEEQENYAGAIEAYHKAIEAEPDYLKALSSLGIIYSQLEQFDKAIRTYLTLLSKYPNYSRARYNLGLAYSKTDQFEKAIEAYTKVIETDPGNIKARTNIGVMYVRTGNIDLAIKTFEDAVDMELENPELRFNLALQYEKADRLTDAIYQYTMAVQLDKTYDKAYEKLIELYEQNGESSKALIVRYERMKQNPDGDAIYQMGKTLLEANEYKHAIEAFQLSSEYGAKKDWTTYWTGMSYYDMNDIDKAISLFNEVIEMDDSHKFAYYRLGQMHDIKGQEQKANGFYAEVLRLDPDFKIVRKNQD